MNKVYEKELIELKLRMEAAEKFAERLPIFAETILEKKLTGSEDWVNFDSRYKQIPLDWGINRGLFTKENRRSITHYDGDYNGYFYTIYINKYSLFGNHCDFGFEDLAKKVTVFFYDDSNATFYATDEQIADLLEELNKWYIKALAENKVFVASKKIEDATRKLEEAKANLNSLTPTLN